MQLHADAQPLQDAGRVGFGLPAAQLGELLLQQAGLDPVLLRHLLFGVERVFLLADLVQTLVAHDDRIHHVVGVVGVLILLQDGHAGVGQDGYLAGGGLQLPGEDLQKGGLARAVGADDAVAVALDELKVHMGKEGLSAVLEAQVGNSDHVLLLIAN